MAGRKSFGSSHGRPMKRAKKKTVKKKRRRHNSSHPIR